MASLPLLDADSHVEECERTWSYLDKQYADRRPINVNLVGRLTRSKQDCVWLIDGQVHPRVGFPSNTTGGSPVESTASSSAMKPFSAGSQTLEDIDARLADMDAMGISATVLFPTVGLTYFSPDVRFDAALVRSYNTWLAERCSHAPTRLKWGAIVPMRSVPDAVAEVRRAKALGAAAAYIFGTVGNALLHDPRFDPVWAEMAAQDLPVAIHVGWSVPALTDMCSDVHEAACISFTLPALMGYYSFVSGGILDRFPALRVAILEAGGDWVPYFTNRMGRYYGLGGAMGRRAIAEKPPLEYLRGGNVYISVEGDDALLPQVIELAGAQAILTSADMPHSEGRDNCLQEIARRDDLSADTKAQILTHNPARFYGISLPG